MMCGPLKKVPATFMHERVYANECNKMFLYFFLLQYCCSFYLCPSLNFRCAKGLLFKATYDIGNRAKQRDKNMYLKYFFFSKVFLIQVF